MLRGIYTIHDLSDFTGVKARTIRTWREQGLLQPALKAGPSPYVWTREHLERIREIQEILDNNMTYADIRERFNGGDESDSYY